MKKSKLPLKSLVLLLVLVLTMALAIRFDGKPHIYTGLIFSYFLALFMGFFAPREYAMPFAAAGVGLGLWLRHIWPPVSKLKDDKLLAYQEKADSYMAFIAKYWWLLLVIALAAALIGSFLGRFFAEEKTKKLTTRQITYMAIFVALSVAINTVRIGSVSFGGFPIIMSGYLLGPLPGFVVGAVADLLGFIVRPSSFGFNPIFTLTSALTGLIPVVFTSKVLRENYPNFTFVKVLIGIFVGQFTTSVVLVPMFQVLLYGNNTFWYFAGKAAIKQLISIPFYAFFTVNLADRLTKAIDFRGLKHDKMAEHSA